MILLETQHVTPTHADNSTPPVHPFVAWAQKVYDLECRTGVRPSRSSGHPWRKRAVPRVLGHCRSCFYMRYICRGLGFAFLKPWPAPWCGSNVLRTTEYGPGVVGATIDSRGCSTMLTSSSVISFIGNHKGPTCESLPMSRAHTLTCRFGSDMHRAKLKRDSPPDSLGIHTFRLRGISMVVHIPQGSIQRKRFIFPLANPSGIREVRTYGWFWVRISFTNHCVRTPEALYPSVCGDGYPT